MAQINGPVFRCGVDLSLAPEFKPGEVVVMTNWTAPCLKSRIHRSCLWIKVVRVNAVPSLPLGKKVADSPDEGAFVEDSVLKRPLAPALSNQFLQERCHVTPRCIRKKSGGEGGNMALSSSCVRHGRGHGTHSFQGCLRKEIVAERLSQTTAAMP